MADKNATNITTMTNAVEVSVVMPAHNSEHFIAESIASVQAQTFANWELIVSDDGSSDRTCAIVKALASRDPRIRLISSPINQGPAVSRNASITAATGRYIAFLDSDDLWTSDKLEKQLAFMKARSLAFSYTGYSAIDEASQKPVHVNRGKSTVTYQDLLAHQTTIGCLTVMFDTTQCGKPLMPEIQRRQDYALWLKILRLGFTAERLDEQLAVYRVRRHSVSRNKIRAAWYVWRVYREVEQLSLTKSLYYFAQYGFYHLVSGRAGQRS